MYQISKVVNNNIVCSVDEDGQEIILRGLGIGYNKKVNDTIKKEDVEKIYKISSSKTRNKLEQLLAEIPVDYLETSTEIIEYAKSKLQQELNENIYITLTDHISFAINRMKNKQSYPNALLMETKCFYPDEFAIGTQAVKIIKKRLKVELPLDEAGFIALHIVNAELNTKISDMVKITELIQGVLEIVKSYYNIDLNEDTLYYDRLVTHLKFFGQRLFNNKEPINDDKTLHELIKIQFPRDYWCANRIRKYIETTYNKKIWEEEMVFLTVHLRRISMNAN